MVRLRPTSAVSGLRGGTFRQGRDVARRTWVPAGILHIETPPSDVVAAGGWSHGLQLWVNLPRQKKWIDPRYQDSAPISSPLETTPGADAVAGHLDKHGGPGSTDAPMTVVHASLAPSAVFLPWPSMFDCLYVLGGTGKVGSERRRR